ncbi:MAG: single-stranded DNA-binding protein [Treponema sp.]|nr:single-stranded DNA-binding protein [Candidatus Treponema equifaecale]
MQSMNQAIIEGKLVRNPELKSTSTGKKFAFLQVANNRYYPGQDGNFQEEVNYFDVEAWGDVFCEKIAKNGTKGLGVRVIGRLKQNRWKSEDGKNNSKIMLIAEHVDFKTPMNKKQPSDKATEKAELNNIAQSTAGLSMDCDAGFDGTGGEVTF